MSTYQKITRHPNTKKYEHATWIDDYFAPHMYGVKFPEDDVVYPVPMVDKAEIKEFWAEDVLETLTNMDFNESELLDFLFELQNVYENRWGRDPEGGEGAVKHYQAKFHVDEPTVPTDA